MTTPMSVNNLTSNMMLNGRQVYMPAMREVSSFLTGPLDSEMSLSTKFNPTGSNGDFFKTMASLMNNFKVQTAQSASMIQSMSTTASPAAPPVAAAVPAVASPAAAQALSTSDMNALSTQLGSIINSLKTMLTPTAAAKDVSTSTKADKVSSGNAGNAADTAKKQTSADKAK